MLNKNVGFDKNCKMGAVPENWKYLANIVPRSWDLKIHLEKDDLRNDRELNAWEKMY